MAVINTEIPLRAFEIVRNRLGEIIADELANQVALFGNTNLDAVVWVERVVPFNHTELPAVNVSLIKGVYGVQTHRQSNGAYAYKIEVVTKAKSADNVRGDVEANFRLQRLLAVIQAILEDSRYVSLGYQTPFIMNRHVEELNILETDPGQETEKAAVGCLIFAVQVPETNAPIDVTIADKFITSLKLSLTDQGYKYEYVTP